MFPNYEPEVPKFTVTAQVGIRPVVILLEIRIDSVFSQIEVPINKKITAGIKWHNDGREE